MACWRDLMKFTDPTWARLITWLLMLLVGWPLLLVSSVCNIERLSYIGLAIIIATGAYLVIIETAKKRG
jgi:hypothetical protein